VIHLISIRAGSGRRLRSPCSRPTRLDRAVENVSWNPPESGPK
jgi:hypothetical protein